MSQQISNVPESVSSDGLSLHNNYAFFMSEATKNRFEQVINSIKLITMLLDALSGSDDYSIDARQVNSLIYLLSDELERTEAEIKSPGMIFSEYQAVHGINLIKKYGSNEITKALDLLSKSGH
ncbi:hypothetical protein PF276_002562 [Salmonella enterica]|nr:hypothetical protein [Salmonella enterica]EKI6154961.1 hypothetical protein [Salmonella enterica]